MAISDRSALMLVLTDKNKGVDKLPAPRTFNQMLAMEFRRQLLVTGCGAMPILRSFPRLSSSEQFFPACVNPQ
jgi:hypothetical protein